MRTLMIGFIGVTLALALPPADLGTGAGDERAAIGGSAVTADGGEDDQRTDRSQLQGP